MDSTSASSSLLGAVIIGRNEGERLVRCLQGLSRCDAPIVYVDSASSDGSPVRAAQLGAHVVPLSLDRPFTAGRARNEGFKELVRLHPQVRYVQFVDGDCELETGWLAFGRNFLEANPEVAIVCGRRQERHPEMSVYNRLCDIEWDTPIGDAGACGGDFLARADVFQRLGGFNDSLIAGEEPEMCHRLRRLGLRIHRAAEPMTLHDAAIMRLSQWSRRTSRAGYAYAARAAMHWRDGTRYCWRENFRIALWALAVPLTIGGLALVSSPWWLLLASIYPLQLLRTATRMRAKYSMSSAMAYAFFAILGKWPEFYGQALFLARRLRGHEQKIIEYK